MSGMLLLLVVVFLDMKKTLAASKVTRAIPSHAAGVEVNDTDGKSSLTHVSRMTLVSFILAICW